MAGENIGNQRVSLNLARIKKGGEQFEIVVDPDLALKLKKGEDIDVRDVLKSEEIFDDANKGLLASKERLKTVFGSDDVLKVAQQIIKEGQVQLTTEHRSAAREEKKKQILQFIHRNCVDPKSHSPHPMTRLENALEQSKVHIDDSRSAEEQVQEVLKALRSVLPIKFEIKEIAMRLSAEHAPKLYGTVKKYGKLLSEEWQKDGSWLCVIELPAGLEVEFYEKMNSETQGNVETKVLKTN